jgi:hypothetical protein
MVELHTYTVEDVGSTPTQSIPFYLYFSSFQFYFFKHLKKVYKNILL